MEAQHKGWRARARVGVWARARRTQDEEDGGARLARAQHGVVGEECARHHLAQHVEHSDVVHRLEELRPPGRRTRGRQSSGEGTEQRPDRSLSLSLSAGTLHERTRSRCNSTRSVAESCGGRSRPMS
jgi:hypothetical protein